MKKDLGVGNGDKTFRVHGVTDLNFEISVVRGKWRIRKERKDLKQLMNSSQALPFSPGRIDAWLFVGLFPAPPS